MDRDFQTRIEAHAFGATAWSSDGSLRPMLEWAETATRLAGGFVGSLETSAGKAFIALVPGAASGSPTVPGRAFLDQAAEGSPDLRKALSEAAVFLGYRVSEGSFLEASICLAGVRLDAARGLHVSSRGRRPVTTHGEPVNRLAAQDFRAGRIRQVTRATALLAVSKAPGENDVLILAPGHPAGQRFQCSLTGGMAISEDGVQVGVWPAGVPDPGSAIQAMGLG